MSQTYKFAQKIANNPLLTPVDGFSPRINSDGEECEISFDFGGLKGIMEEMEREDPIDNIRSYVDEEISTKSSSPLGQMYLKQEKSNINSIYFPFRLEEFAQPQLDNIQNVHEKPNDSENSLFTFNHPVNLNFLKENSFQQPIRRKKIKISQVLKKKWKTKLPSFIDNQKSKLISKINLIKNQNINKYKIENELKMSLMNYEEMFTEEKVPNRRSKNFNLNFLVSHQVQRTKDCDNDFYSNQFSKSAKFTNFSNKFNANENTDLNKFLYLKNRNSFYENKCNNYPIGSNLQMKNSPVNIYGSINLNHFSFDINTKCFLTQKSNCKYS